MNRYFQDLKDFSLSLPIFEKSTSFDDKNINFLRPDNLLFTRNALAVFMCGRAE